MIDTQKLAEEFCRWPLPATVCADPCACTPNAAHRNGTNLLSVAEAKAFFDHLWLTGQIASVVKTPNGIVDKVGLAERYIRQFKAPANDALLIQAVIYRLESEGLLTNGPTPRPAMPGEGAQESLNSPEMTPVKSSNVSAIGYDAEANELHVQFSTDGPTYVYQGVDPAGHQALMNAPSIGKHIATVIKPNHAFRTIGQPWQEPGHPIPKINTGNPV